MANLHNRALMPPPQAGVVNIASVPQLSPFRYPGGKTWLTPWIRLWLRSLIARPRTLVDLFAGGGSIGLVSVFEHLVDYAVLVELDSEVAAVWKTMFSLRANDLAETIMKFECTRDSANGILNSTPNNIEEKAFATILANRVRYGGILAPGAASVRHGENGRGVSSRWYPETLKNRILSIAGKKEKFAFVHGDGVDFLQKASRYRNVAFFIDPPYTVAGQRLYTHSEIDHVLLFRLASRLSGDFLITYDDAEEIVELARQHDFDVERVLMQSTKHVTKTELLIGRNLDWARVQPSLSIELPEDTPLELLQANGTTSS